MLETGLAADEQTSAEFDAVIEQHIEARKRSAREPAAERPGIKSARPAAKPARPRRDASDRSRLDELSHRHGWAWLRLFRRYDDYAAALRHLDEAPPAERSEDASREPERV
jgi:hypothetical protein